MLSFSPVKNLIPLFQAFFALSIASHGALGDDLNVHPDLKMPEFNETGLRQKIKSLSVLSLIDSLARHGEESDLFFGELSRRGEEAIPFLVQALLEGENYEVRIQAARAMGDILFQLPIAVRLAYFQNLKSPLLSLLKSETRDRQRNWVLKALLSFFETTPPKLEVNPSRFSLSPDFLLMVKTKFECGQILDFFKR